MTVQTNTNSIAYVGNGSTVHFDYDFLILDASHLKVYFGDVLQTSGYVVSGVLSQTGGTVAFAVAPPSGTAITLTRSVPFLQLTDYQPYDAFPAESHERALDLLTMMAQQLKDASDRSMQYPVGGNKWDAKGNEIINVGAGQSDSSAPNVGQVKSLISALAGPDSAVQLRAELAADSGTDLIGHSGGMSLTDLINTEPAVVTPYITVTATPRDGFQAAVNAGSVRVPAGSNITISGDITIPANRLIVVDFGATITSNGRFTAYGVNNVHWIINGSVLSAGMTVAPAKSGWPNTGEGTQLGDERGFIEFGGVTFAGNDGDNYSVRVGSTGVIGGDWTGTPNFTDQVRQVNRKGIAAWNCSNVHFESDGEIYGFEGEAVYWFSRSAAGKNVYMRVKSLHDCRFNGLNVNALLAHKNIKIEKSVTKNTYQGIESSSGDILDCVDYSSVKHSIYAGHGHGGDGRKISGNMSFDCLDVPFAITYDRTYETLGRVKDVVFVDNHAVNPASGVIAIADIENIQAHRNTCSGLKAGRFLQVTGCQGGSLTGNMNYNPAVGTEHYYEADCYSLFKANNKKVSLGGSYNALMKANDDFTGGLNSAITTHGNRENFVELRATVPNIGTGPEYRFSYDQTLPFVAATIGSNLTGYGANGAKADIAFNNLKINTGDTLGASWFIRSTGHFEPSIDGFSNVGSASKRCNTIYAAVGAINTSDEREKVKLDVSDAERNAALEIKSNMWKFQFKAANEEKNGNGRYHFGVGAQTVGAILAKHGLDPAKYAFFCYDEWDEEQIHVIDDETGLPTGELVTITEAGNRYGIRYEELLCFIIAAM